MQRPANSGVRHPKNVEVWPPLPTRFPERPSHLLARVLRRHSATVQALCGADAEFGAFVLNLDQAGFHYLRTCLALVNPQGFESIASRRSFARLVRTKPRTEVVSALRGRPVAAGWRRALLRVSGQMSDAGYRLLLDLLDHDDTRRVLLGGAITERRLRALASLPPFVRGAGIERLAMSRYGRETLLYALGVLRRWRPTLRPADLFRSLLCLASADELENWLTRLLERAEAPKPPWPGSAELRPLATGRAVRRAARRFRNCLDERYVEVLAGQVYFYEWAGPPPAIVALRHDPLFGWYADEVAGIANRPLGRHAQRRLIDLLGRHGIPKLSSPWRFRF